MNRRVTAISVVKGDNSAAPPSPFILDPPGVPNGSANSSAILDSYLDAIYRRRWWILGGVALAVTLAWSISELLPRSYQGTAILEVERAEVSALVRELQSDAVMRRAIDKFHLLDSDRSALKVIGPANTQQIRITYRHRDPEIAAGVANWIAKSYVQNSQADLQGKFNPLGDLEAKMEKSQRALLEFVHKNGMTDPEAKMNALNSRLLELDMSYAKAQSQRERKEAGLRVAPAGSPEAARAQSELQQARQRETDLSTAYLRTKAEAEALPSYAAEYQTLRQRADADRALYQEVSRTIGKTGIASPRRTIPVRIAQLAVPDTHSASPNVPLICALALLSSVLVGCGGAIVLEQRDSRLRTVEQVHAIAGGQPVMALPTVHIWRDRRGFAMFSVDTQRGKSGGDIEILEFRAKIRMLCDKFANRRAPSACR